ncbi:hypothetical protein BsWGS_24225 [Bradybaena similaris]
MADKEAAGSKLDVSLLRTPIQISGKPVEQVLNSIHYGSPELRCLLMDECDLIFECKVCRALFRDLPNFISHKRAYCTKSALETRHVTIANLPEEKVVVIQPQAPEETNIELASTSQQQKPVRANLEQTIQRIQSGDLGRSHAYKVYTEAAEKLQRQKEGMKVATIRTTTIPTNKNAVFIDVNMTSVNIHERQQQGNNGVISYDQTRNDSSVTVIKRKTAERHGSTRNVRKSTKQERQSSEPQKLLMEQLKEIQHKVKQKVAAAHDKTAQDKTAQQKKVRSGSQNSVSQRDPAPPSTTESSQKAPANTNTTRAQKKLADSSGLKVLSTDNVQSAPANDEETKDNVKDESDPEEVKYALVKHKVDSTIYSKTAKENKALAAIGIAATRRKKLTKRSPVCLKCNSAFATTKSLHYHEQIHHAAKRTFYPCPYCSSVFYYFFGITRHLFRNHSMSLDEINAMRRQLRERSFTKPFSTPLNTKGVCGSPPRSGRSTRSLGRIQLLSLSQDTSSLAESSVLNDKHSTKKTSGDSDNIVSETSSKIARQKMAQANTTQEEHHHSLKSSASKTSDKSEDFVSAKEDREEARPVRLKNRQQVKSGDNTSKPGCSNSLNFAHTAARTPVPSSPIISRSQDKSHLCPKCHRAFRRKISCKNHVKVCNAKGSSTHKPVRTTRYTSQQLTPESVASVKNNKLTKVKTKNKTNSCDSTEKAMAMSDNQSTSLVKIPENKVENAVILQEELSDRKTTLRNSSVDRNSQAQRSSSVDRIVTNDEPRNRSRERNSATRDERDSSVESTQSNMEGKSPRNRRSVLSKYAIPSQQSKSPSKLDAPVKSDVRNVSYEKLSDSQQVGTGKNSSEAEDTPHLNCKDKAAGDDIKDDNLKIENKSTEASEGEDLGMPATPIISKLDTHESADIINIIDHAQDVLLLTDNDTKLHEEIDHTTTLSQISSLPPVVSNRSQEKQQQHSPSKSLCSPSKVSMKDSSPSPHKLSGYVGKSDSFPDLSLDSCKPEVVLVNEDSCENANSTSAVPSEVVDTVEDKLEVEPDNVIKSEEIILDDVDSDFKQDAKKDLILTDNEKLDMLTNEHMLVGKNLSLQQDVQIHAADRKSAENDLSIQEVKLDISDSKQQTLMESSIEMEPTVQYQGGEELPEILQVECDSKSIDLTVQEDKMLHLKKPEVTHLIKAEVDQLKKPELVQLKKPEVDQLKQLELTQLKNPEADQLKKPEADKLKKPELTQLKKSELTQLKKPEVTSEEQTISEIKNSMSSGNVKNTLGNVKNTPGNSKNKETKPQNLPPIAVVSALSERPKRKRKVPSRNKDAEEMLSKIHNHNRDREVVPVKKTKLTQEIKVSESPRKKSKAENLKIETLTAVAFDTNCGRVSDEPEIRTKKRRLNQMGESHESECADDDSDEVLGKAKGRFVSNRMYVLEKIGTKNKRLKCYDQMKVYRMIDEDLLKCLECGESCSQMCNLRRHVIRQHLKWSRFKCKLCKFESYDRSECATHLIRGHKNRAISLRNVNQFILDLVKQGSHARSRKKTEAVKVKQLSKIQEGNIYARPTVKKMPKLPQKAEEGTTSRSTMNERSGNRDITGANGQPQLWRLEDLIPARKFSEGTSFVAVSKIQTNKLTSPKFEAHSKQSIQQQTSAKIGLEAIVKPQQQMSSNAGLEATGKPQQQTSSKAGPEATGKSQQLTSSKAGLEAAGKPNQQTSSKTGVEATVKPLQQTSSKTGVEATVKPQQQTSSKAGVEAAVKPLQQTSSKAGLEATGKPQQKKSIKAGVEATVKPQQQTFSKAGVEAAGKTTRKTLPFNISTRNSPRTFDTRPYNPAGGDVPDEIEASVSKQKFLKMTSKVIIEEEIVSPSGKVSQMPDARTNGSLDNDVEKPGSALVGTALVESPGADSVQKSRNIFDNIKTPTFLPTAVSSMVTTTTTVSKPASAGTRELNVSSSVLHQASSPRIIEVKVESPKNFVSVSSSQILNQKLEPSHKKTAGVKTDKPKIVSYVFRGPQLNSPSPSSDTVNSDQLAKSLIQLDFGDVVGLPSKLVSPSAQFAKLNLPPGKFSTAQVIDSAHLQRKHTSVPPSLSATPKITPVDNLKVTPKIAGASKETAGPSSGLSLAAALTKGGHIFTTVATSFIVSHGQAGKFIVYTRPAGAKDSTTVSSVTRQSPVPSPVSVASPAVPIDSKTLDTTSQRDSQSQGAVAEDVLSPGTFVIRKHYL